MSMKLSIAEFKIPFQRCFFASIIALVTFCLMMVTLPDLMTLPPAAANAALAILSPKLLFTFGAPLYQHARAVRVGATHNLRIARVSNGIRALRLYYYSVRAFRRRARA